MNFGPKGYVNDSPWRLSLICTYNARTVFTNADLHALFKAAWRINYHVIALQEKNLDGRETAPMVRRVHHVEGVGFVVNPFAVHMYNSYKVLSPRLAFQLHTLHQKTIFIINSYSPTSAADDGTRCFL
ncbi:unnamed protein product [Strongylus vulgaris]|uniref:Endonuclease/exonuclease/phosphatase domain-containing protein n=1 Tax=Strongylus vulgaris TaxID=40348 RepID=A0A3P7J801_STRVU|nr:unnamed protein product [Strongylus vulgaris]